MVTGMAMKKITVTLPTDQVDVIKALVAEGQSSSVSGFVQHAVQLAIEDVDAWATMLDQALQETGGPLTPEEEAWADSMMGVEARKRTRERGRAA